MKNKLLKRVMKRFKKSNFKNLMYKIAFLVVFLCLLIYFTFLSFIMGQFSGFKEGADYMLDKNVFNNLYCKDKEADIYGTLSKEFYIYEDDRYKIIKREVHMVVK